MTHPHTSKVRSSAPKTPRRLTRQVTFLLLAAAAVLPWATSVMAQSDPTTIGAGQRPYVLILMDSSASMEFTTEGDGYYPTENNNNPSNDDSQSKLDTWSPEKTLNGGDSSRYGTADGLTLVGPCYVWEPKCDKYDRPSWYPGDGLSGDLSDQLHPESKNNSLLNNRIADMRGSANVNILTGVVTKPNKSASNSAFRRLSDSNQPKHVQLKEILTGDMVLLPRNALTGAKITSLSVDLYSLNPREYGPGCWFVPRMHGAAIGEDTDKLCFGHGGNVNNWDENKKGSFQKYVDYDDPRPHLQEVFDFQHRTGLMDNFANTALFAVALFDGYPGCKRNSYPWCKSGAGGTILHETDDRPSWPNDGTSTDLPGRPQPVEGDGESYNLGVHKIVGPKTLWKLSSSELPVVTEFTQLALVDAGYLRNKDVGDNKRWKVDPKKPNEHGFTPFSFSQLDEKQLPIYYSGQQSIGGGTPLAAALYDIHNFFINGQAEFKDDGRPENYSSGSDNDEGNSDDKKGYNPIQNDRYKECRPKHVIVMTDGAPAPERPGGINDIGTNFLNKGFGYDEALDLTIAAKPGVRYRYETAEVEIESLVTDPALNPPSPDPRYQPHVHIVGLTPIGPDVPATERQKIAEKLGAMAAYGGTCAEYWLTLSPEGREFIPSTWGTGGTCNPATGNCLIEQLPGGQIDGNNYIFPPPSPVDPSPVQISCRAPALLLTKNDACSNGAATCNDGTNSRAVRDDLTFALSLIFNQVLDSSGGIASRTKPTITNSIDTAATLGQHRIYSGVQISGGSRYWKGLLNRQNLVCRADTSVNANNEPFDDTGVTNLHDEIAAQVRDNGTDFEDNRRIFTSVKYIDTANPSQQGIPSPANETDVIFTGYDLKKVATSQDDEFYNFSSLSAAPIGPLWQNAEAALMGTRVPLTYYDLAAANNYNTANDPTVPWTDILNVADAAEARSIIDLVRGRTREKMGKTLNAILNTNPVTLEPPTRDLPIDSYRAYRELYEQRPTMLFVSTLDGLLHGIYTGEHKGGKDLNGRDLKIKHRQFSTDNTGTETDNDSISQREAWAYSPELLRKQYALFSDRQPNLLDGGLVVRDVRLCHEKATLNQNRQACLAVSSSTALPGSQQWRSVLVAGLGQSGSGYFALDVTRTGQLDANSNATVPDPIPLWELGPDWEQRQIRSRQGSDFDARFSSPTQPANWTSTDRSCLSNSNDVREFDSYSFMGLSTGEPEIATVILDVKANERVQRPVAIFTAGQASAGAAGDTCLRDLRSGRAIYVVDLQTGTILRRFVSYFDGPTEKRFEAAVVGSPTAYNNVPGTVANRAFTGDSLGRLFRIDMSSPKIEDWRVNKMYDPCEDDDLRAAIGTKFSSNADVSAAIGSTTSCQSNRGILGESAFKPSVALGRERNIIVTYGLGDRTDISTANKVQAVIALTEQLKDKNGSNFVDFELETDANKIVQWSYVFEEGEKLTGEPVIFNKGTYFTSYVENILEPCKAGKSRIYGLDYEGDGLGGYRGFFNLSQLGFTSCPSTGVDGVLCGYDPTNTEYAIWTGPEEPALIRGLSITLGPVCSLDFGDPNNQKFNEKADPQPTLLATMGGAKPPNSKFGEGNPDPLASNDLLSRFKVQLQPPRSQLMPLSFVSLGQ